MKVLVIGGTRFIGKFVKSVVREEIVSGHDVAAPFDYAAGDVAISRMR